MTAAFRPDIEGLRALSIGLVLVFHAAAPVLPGGFVGVDVFFVISGFLITTSLLTQHVAGASLGANLARFWARRVRRLLPNALLVLLATALAAAWTQGDPALRRTAAELGWSAVDAVNWLFVRRSVDYLNGGGAETSVLLNYWSLAVEEQFYLLWPPLLLLLWRRAGGALPRSVHGAALALAVASFVHMLWLGREALAAAFFASTARAWELMAGVALALALREGRVLPQPAGQWLAAAGLVAIGAAALGFSAATPHPGWPTLLPVLGAAAVVAGLQSATPAAPLVRWLGARPLRALGARSYSIYLWHWPVLVFSAAWWPAAGPAARVAQVGVALLLAEAAYRGVETPARFRWARERPPRAVLAAGVAGSLAVLGLAVLLMHGAETGARSAWLPGAPRGAPGLPPLRALQADLPPVYDNGCHAGFDAEAPAAPAERCRFGAAGAREVLLFGDSHAAQWLPALQPVAAARGLAVLSWTKSACPAADVTPWNPSLRAPYRACDRWRDTVLQQVLARRPALVVVSGFVDGAAAVVDRGSGRRRHGADALAAHRDGLARTLARLRAAGVPVVLLRDTPRPRRTALDCLYGQPDPAACARPAHEAWPDGAPDLAAAALAGVPAWDLGPAVCAGGRCPVVVTAAGGRLQVVYRDDDHLTASFAATLAPALERAWAAQPPGPPLP